MNCSFVQSHPPSTSLHQSGPWKRSRTRHPAENTPAASQNILDLTRCSCNALQTQGIWRPGRSFSRFGRYPSNGSFPFPTNLRLPNPRGNLRDLAGPHDILEMQPRRESEQMPHGEEHSARGHRWIRDWFFLRIRSTIRRWLIERPKGKAQWFGGVPILRTHRRPPSS